MPPWVSVRRYLSKTQSVGPREKRARGSEMMSYEQSDADMLTLLSLLSDDAIRKIACIPDRRLCVYEGRRSKLSIRHSAGKCPSPPPGHRARLQIRGGVIVTDASTRPKLSLPKQFANSLDKCRQQGKRFAIANFGIYNNQSLAMGHANALVFDLRERVIERFDPAGRHSVRAEMLDVAIESLFHARLPQWTYVGTRAAAPIEGVQSRADAFDGMCVTYSFMYTLLRLLNPSRSSREIQHYMIRGSAADLRRRVKRLNRFMMDTLRGHKRGTLSSL